MLPTSFNKFSIISLLLIYFRSLFVIFNNKHDTILDKHYNSLKEELLHHDISYLLPNKLSIKLEFSYINLLSSYFSKQLKTIKPKIVFIETYHGYIGMGLCHACKKMNIKSVDVQHGVQGKYHSAYSYFSNIPSQGYNVMPNYFLTWSKKESDIINAWAPQDTKIRSFMIGNPIQKIFLTNSSIFKYFDKLFIKHYNAEINKFKVLITLQNSLSFPKIYYSLICNSPDNYYYFVRFHPCTTFKEKQNVKMKMKGIPNQKYSTGMASELPIYAMLRNIDIHITEDSSVVIEAACFSVKSIVTCETAIAHYEDYINEELVYYCSNEQQILKRLSNFRSKKRLDFDREKCDSSNDTLGSVLDHLIPQ